MGCLCGNVMLPDFETVSLKIDYIAEESSEFLIWHRYCTMCRQNWFVKIELPESERQIFVLRDD